jgi:predicted DNA-binding transcriptional regulator YafY
MFRVDRIRAIHVSDLTARSVEVATEVEPMSVALGSTGRTVLVDVTEGAALLDRHPVTRRWALADGGVRAELPVGDWTWARRLVLGSGGSVVLREPEWLVTELIDTATASLRQHLPEFGASGASE